MISEKQIQELLNSGASTTVEFKLCTDHLSASVYETVCAFLNREGGQIIVGVDDSGTLIGVNRPCIENMTKSFINTLNNPQLFIPIAFLVPEVVEVEGKAVIYINVPDKFRLDEQNINQLDVRNLIFREIVANMLIHREYSHSFSSKLLLFADRVITENWTKPVQYGDVTIDNWESHTKNPLITKVFREMKWVEELGSGKKNIKKYAPLYYDDYRIEIQNNEKFVFTITYREAQNAELGVGEVGLSRDQVTDKSGLSWEQVGTKLGLSWDQVGTKLGLSWSQVNNVLSFCIEERSISELSDMMEFTNRSKFKNKYINPLLEEGLLSMTLPDKTTSPLQKYYTTEKGKLLLLDTEQDSQ